MTLTVLGATSPALTDRQAAEFPKSGDMQALARLTENTSMDKTETSSPAAWIELNQYSTECPNKFATFPISK
jgi:hypothetical protein